MIIQFTVGNYKSFKDKVTFSMVAANITAQDKEMDQNNTFQVDDDLTLLKSTVIYGANASGKSNLISAIRFMRQLVLFSSKDTQSAEPISVEPFRLNTETVDKPTFFEMVFILEGRTYRYGFEVDTEKVVSEWLFHVPTIREAKLFERHDREFEIMPAFKEGREIDDKTRDNALFLSVVSQFNGKLAQKILRWFGSLNVIYGIDDRNMRSRTVKLFEKGNFKDDVTRFILNLDTGIDNIQVQTTPLTIPPDAPEELVNLLDASKAFLKKLTNRDGHFEQIEVFTTHRKYDAEGNLATSETFDLDKNESEGTRKIFALAGIILDVLKKGRIIFIDEFDARLHPLITRAIIELFNSQETNPHNAQFVFVTHDTNLLDKDMFRRDQIWFAEKDKFGATHLHSLVEYKERNDASFKNNYIRGKYGAIPFIGDLSRLVEISND